MNLINKIVRSSRINLILRIALGGVFVYSGFVKLIDPKSFAKVISQYDLIPEILLAPVAIGLPLFEFLAGVGLIFNMRGSLSAIFGMLIMFIVVLWYGILKDLSIDCGCFTPEEIADHNSLKRAFYRDVFMVGIVLFMYLHRFVRSDRSMGHRSWLVNIL